MLLKSLIFVRRSRSGNLERSFVGSGVLPFTGKIIQMLMQPSFRSFQLTTQFDTV